MKESSNEFVILLDSDRKLEDPVYSIEQIKRKTLKKNRLYRFVAHSLDIGKNVHESVNDYLISKSHFFSAGGYDEEWIGYRNGDRQFFEQLKFFGDEKLLHDINILLLRSASLRLDNKEICSENDLKNPSKKDYDVVIQRTKKPEPNKKILTFEWERLS